jgi:glycosyltransferase involved in cell wall biosynthesis/ubiquinone/menaquinone biosynthesis C-methylase UbiE
MRWVAFGTYDIARHPRVGVLIEGLRAAGDEVVEVNAPMDLDTAARVQLLRQPWRIPLAGLRLIGCWVRLAVASRGVQPDAVLVGYLGHLDVRWARVLFRRTPIALDHLVFLAGTADDRGLVRAGGRKERALAAVDRAALRAADVVIVDTQEHADAVATATGQSAVVVPVGAEHDWFAARRPCGDGAEAPLRVVFFGLFTALQGTVTVGQALAALADRRDLDVTMVGLGQEYEQCRQAAAANANVDWLGWVSRADLPALVASHDVCLGIFGTTEKARNVVPTKVYQGAAAGCAIVTSGTAPQRRMLCDDTAAPAAVFVPPGDPAALAEALAGLAADRDRLDSLRARAADRADAMFKPVSVVAPLRRRIDDLLHHPRPTTEGSAVTSMNGPLQTPAVENIPDAPLAPRAALRWDVVRRTTAGVAPSTILEIGCGMGAMGMRLARTAEYTAVEPDDTSYAVARARISGVGGTVLHGDHTSVPAGQQYDLVCAFEVLEHISDDAEALDQWLPLVKPGGHLLLSVPADPDKFGPWDTLVGHYRRYDADQLSARLTEAGAEVITVTHYAWPLGYIMESVRNVIAGRRKLDEGETPEDRSTSSGRSLQPRKALVGKMIEVAVVPWSWLQRARTGKGPGLVALASRPARPSTVR